MSSRTIMRWLLLAALLPIMALVACTYQAKDSAPSSSVSLVRNIGGEDESDGIGGTGLQSEGDGIGGTGMLAEGDGIGGTGIIGPISGFGSIIVNGMHVDYSPEMPIILNGEPASTAELKIGRVVEVHARPAAGELSAHSIAVLDAVVGPVEVINKQDGSVRILGQRVYLDRETVLFSNLDLPGVLKSLKLGDLLRVSGLHLANGSLVATRMEPAEPGADWFVMGLVSGLTTDSFAIGGLQIKRDAVWPDGLQNGRLVQVRGEQVDGRFLGQDLRLKPDVPFSGRVERLVVQGYPRPAKRSGLLRMGNLQMDMPAGSAVKGANLRGSLIHQRIELTAYIGRRGGVRAEKIVTIRLAPAAAIGRLFPSVKLPTLPNRDLKWNRTPDQGVPKPPLSGRPIKLQRPPLYPRIRRPIRLKPLPRSRPPLSVVRPAIVTDR